MTTQRSGASGGTVGRPRDPDVDRKVIEATLELLVSHGYAGLRIDEIAKTSGVAKTTIYRRWTCLPLLVLDAVEAALGLRNPPDTGDPVADLQAILVMVHESLVTNRVGWNLPQIGIDLLHQPELADEYRRRFIFPLRSHAIALINDGAERGLFRPVADAEDLVDAIAGTFMYRKLVRGAQPPSIDGLLALARAALGLTEPPS